MSDPDLLLHLALDELHGDKLFDDTAAHRNAINHGANSSKPSPPRSRNRSSILLSTFWHRASDLLSPRRSYVTPNRGCHMLL